MSFCAVCDPPMVAFLVASVVLAVTPGAGVLFIVTRTLDQGRVAGLTSVLGVALGNFGNAVGASLGLAAIFAISPTAFLVVKYLGAGYLVYMGVRALRPKDILQASSSAPEGDVVRILRDGFWVALLNPKTTLFFATFLPQFLDASSPALSQSMKFSALFVCIALATDTVYVLLAAKAAPRLKRLTQGTSMGRYVTAIVFIGLGIWAAVSGPHFPRV
ncbi:MAG: LysE family translocator [Candidatus Puniceispirillum sp.]|nr:LysE family translocator [Candidatus Puniceispirillum sp.]